MPTRVLPPPGHRRRRRRPARSRARTQTRWPRRRFSVHRVALAAGATLERSLRLIERIGRPSGPPAGADGHVNRSSGAATGGRGRTAGQCGCSRADRRGPDPDEGRRSRRWPVPRDSPSSISWHRRRRPPDDCGHGGAADSVLRLARGRTAPTALPSSVGRLVKDVKAVSPVPVAVGFGVSTPTHVHRGRRRRCQCVGSRDALARRRDLTARRPWSVTCVPPPDPMGIIPGYGTSTRRRLGHA
jgi:hypothetical protein